MKLVLKIKDSKLCSSLEMSYCYFGESIGLEFNPKDLELFRTIPSLSEPIRKMFCILFDARRVKTNPIYSDSARGINTNKSEPTQTKFFNTNQSEFLRTVSYVVYYLVSFIIKCYVALTKVSDCNSYLANHSYSEPFRVIPNESKKRFVSRLMQKDQKSIRFNPKHQSK